MSTTAPRPNFPPNSDGDPSNLSFENQIKFQNFFRVYKEAKNKDLAVEVILAKSLANQEKTYALLGNIYTVLATTLPFLSVFWSQSAEGKVSPDTITTAYEAFTKIVTLSNQLSEECRKVNPEAWQNVIDIYQKWGIGPPAERDSEGVYRL
jgi:hypothetical protein